MAELVVRDSRQIAVRAIRHPVDAKVMTVAIHGAFLLQQLLVIQGGCRNNKVHRKQRQRCCHLCHYNLYQQSKTKESVKSDYDVYRYIVNIEAIPYLYVIDLYCTFFSDVGSQKNIIS